MILQCVTRQSLAQFSLSCLLLGDRPAVHIAHVRIQDERPTRTLSDKWCKCTLK